MAFDILLAIDYSMSFVKSQASGWGSRIVFGYIEDYHSTDSYNAA